jgi:C-terminal processing protease CtpA/Prc
VYVLTSEFSFSCGNLLPSIMKDQRYTGVKNVASINLIGQTSGGGAGAVMVFGTGDGAGLRTSSAFELIYSDGNSVDAGVVPDLPLDYSIFYNDTEMYNALKKEYGTNF